MKVLTLKKSDGKKINNLYHPTTQFRLESFDVINLQHCLNRGNSKFLPILLKEFFSLLKENGELNILYSPKTVDLSSGYLEQTLWWLFKRQYKIIGHDLKRNSYKLIVQKTVSSVKPEQGIDYWTFGMVTNGVRRDFIEKAIQSIRDLKIPHYEIIVCGFYNGKKAKDIRYIKFIERDDRGWITRKKNIIAENARYVNLCIFHDRIVFNKDWYRGMKKYGNNFEVLTCVQKLADGTRTGDWVSINESFKTANVVYKIDELDYRDWNKFVYIGGMLTIIKKYIWEKVPWNETLYWGQGEDIEYSHHLTEYGFLPRFNLFSSCLSLSWRFGRLPRRQFSNRKRQLWYNLSDVPARRIIRLANYYSSRLPITAKILRLIFPMITKTKIYNFLTRH